LAAKNKKVLSFEDSLNRLEEISELLENESLGLDESIKLYEEGIKLSKSCFETLDKAELKVIDLKSKLEQTIKTGEETED
jgi:exodeoxyribonuclease VII small subunit